MERVFTFQFQETSISKDLLCSANILAMVLKCQHLLRLLWKVKPLLTYCSTNESILAYIGTRCVVWKQRNSRQKGLHRVLSVTEKISGCPPWETSLAHSASPEPGNFKKKKPQKTPILTTYCSLYYPAADSKGTINAEQKDFQTAAFNWRSELGALNFTGPYLTLDKDR